MQNYSEEKEALGMLFSNISEREKEVLVLRYGLLGEKTKTLEQIGKRYSLTRERIRQVQSHCLKKLRTKSICPILPNRIPMFFTEFDNQKGIYLLSADICKMKFKTIKIDNKKLFLEKNTYNNFIKVQKYTKSLPNSIPYNEKLGRIIKLTETLKIPKELLKVYLNRFKTKQNKTERISEILANTAYPMHFSEVHRILSESFDIGAERNVLAIMQRRDDIFVRVSNGVYTLKSEENPESVAFIKELIIEYLDKYKEGTPMEIYNYVIKRRQCSYSSIPMYLVFGPDFKEISKGVYSLRNLKGDIKKILCLDTIIDNLFLEKDQIPMSEFVVMVQRKMPEVSMAKLYDYLDSNTKISVQDNFILKKQ